MKINHFKSYLENKNYSGLDISWLPMQMSLQFAPNFLVLNSFPMPDRLFEVLITMWSKFRIIFGRVESQVESIEYALIP